MRGACQSRPKSPKAVPIRTLPPSEHAAGAHTEHPYLVHSPATCYPTTTPPSRRAAAGLMRRCRIRVPARRCKAPRAPWSSTRCWALARSRQGCPLPERQTPAIHRGSCEARSWRQQSLRTDCLIKVYRSARSMAATASGSCRRPRISACRRTTAKSPQGEGCEVRKPLWRGEGEVAAKGRRDLSGREVVERDVEDEAPERRRVEVPAEVERAGEGQRMALHPGQHLVYLTHLPGPLCEQRINYVENEEGAGIMRVGDVALGRPYPRRQETGTAGGLHRGTRRRAR